MCTHSCSVVVSIVAQDSCGACSGEEANELAESGPRAANLIVGLTPSWTRCEGVLCLHATTSEYGERTT
ncbi:hypothetical protein DVH24_006208 [Malus domestica]|uniref:Uncharacterized protein n=1 Tax=Malus domestica TaxID=3750 RepID=A0A498KQZ0_MALDO|nr:hypothetical protein DVH24_006208 [Malus domestica]